MYRGMFTNRLTFIEAAIHVLSFNLRLPLLVLGAVLTAALTISPLTLAQEDVAEVGTYKINAGDFLALQVWNEPSLSSEQILVRPDGFISVPVLGELRAGGKTIGELQQSIATGLSRYLKDKPTVVVSALNNSGSLIFVLGKVLRSGAYPMTGPTDVTQALALAGGLNSFAAENKIKVLRRDTSGVQRAIKFRYGQVKDGDRLESNILLQSGDVVLVP